MLLYIIATIFVLTSSTVIISSDLSGEVNLRGFTPYVAYYNHRNLPDPSKAHMIWAGPYTTTTFDQNFTTYCNQPITIYASVADQFWANLNGVRVLQGNNWRVSYSTTVQLSRGILNTCGQNTFRISAGHINPDKWVYYQIAQNTDCISCGFNFFDTTTCSYVCEPPLIWYDEPDCDCLCPPHEPCEPPLFWQGEPECKCKCQYEQL